MTKNYHILAIGGSTSQHSINRAFAHFAARQIGGNVTLLDLNEFEMPIFSVDREKQGYPELAYKFRTLIEQSDGIVISLAEHNGSYTAAFKNIMDWASRINRNLWQDKPMLLLSASPGARGAQNVMTAALDRFPRLGGNIIAHFSLPKFHEHFDGISITDTHLAERFYEVLEKFIKSLKNSRAS